MVSTNTWIALGVCFSLILAFLSYYFLYVKKPTLIYKSNPRNSALLAHCLSLRRNYWPTFWALNRHVQTFLVLLPSRPPTTKKVILPSGDGGTLTCDVFDSKRFDELSPVCVLFHGVNGNTKSGYLLSLAKSLKRNGIRVMALGSRSMTKTPCLSNRYFKEGKVVDDIKTIIDYAHEMYPRAPLFACGFSIGANRLTRYLGENPDTPLIAAVGLGNPFDLHVIERWVEKPIGKHVYNRLMTMERKQLLLKESDPRVDQVELKKAKNFRELDELITPKLFDYTSPEEYYYKESSKRYLPNIKIPYLLMSSLDDPLIPPWAIGYSECVQNENIILALTETGGHLGWFEGLFLRPTFSECVVNDWFKANLDLKKFKLRVEHVEHVV